MTALAVAMAANLACSSTVQELPADVILRVSATTGLPHFLPGPGQSGSTAAALDLVYDLLKDHADVAERRETAVLLKTRPVSPYSADELASSLQFAGLRATQVRGSEIVAEFVDEPSADAFASYSWRVFALGRYRVEQHEENLVRLRRKSPGAIDVIELVALHSSDEWRQLMARQVDVMPRAPSPYRARFADMKSISVIDGPPDRSAALFFNLADPLLARRDVRHYIASVIDREALAVVMCGDRRCAAAYAAPVTAKPTWPDSDKVTLSLLVLASESADRLAADVLRHQLAKVGIQVAVDAVEAVDVDLAVRRILLEGDFQLLMASLPFSPRRYEYFTAAAIGRLLNVTGFQDSEYDAAFRRGDRAAMDEILRREIPVLPLYERRWFAAIDGRFCGDVTPQFSSLRWLAELRPCREE